MAGQRRMGIINLEKNELENLDTCNFIPAEVSCFKHAILHKLLSKRPLEGILVEVHNYGKNSPFANDDSSSSDREVLNDASAAGERPPLGVEYYWPAKIIEAKGYYVHLQFLSSFVNSSQDFWAHILSANIHPIGHSICSLHHIFPRKPPHCRIEPADTPEEFLSRRYTAQPKSLPPNLHKVVYESLTVIKSSRLALNPLKKLTFEIGMQVEVQGAEQIDKFFVGYITNVIGTRIEVQYIAHVGNTFPTRKTVWCDKESQTIQPCGWSKAIGHQLVADESYNPEELDTALSKYENFDYGELKVGQKLEVIYPLNRCQLYVASVTEILSFGYIMVLPEVDLNQPRIPFCVHLSSPEIFPLGFAHRNKVDIARFDLEVEMGNPNDQVQAATVVPTPVIAVPNSLFLYTLDQKVNNMNLRVANACYNSYTFVKHMRLEAADWLRSQLMCPATILNVYGAIFEHRELLEVRYDGYDCRFDQLVVASSCEIYPVGYCKLIGYPLEPPPATGSYLLQPSPTKSCDKHKNTRSRVSSTTESASPFSDSEPEEPEPTKKKDMHIPNLTSESCQHEGFKKPEWKWQDLQ